MSPRPLYKQLWQQVLKTGGLISIPEVLSRRVFDLMLEEKAMFFCDLLLLYTTIARVYPGGYDGEFYRGYDYVINNEFTMFVRKGLDPRIRRKLHLRLRWLWESGLPQDWVHNQMERALESEKSKGGVSASNMKLEDVGAIFYLFLIGLGFSASVFILEVFAAFVSSRHNKLLPQ
ncbi:hypothetical protein HPB47_024357 [Ixodes persulcatus]|uniref:Uncharacterized protein n=1 Tax=Ixodes persulcatus TaxID=34615 RepID=A0AC60Q7H4_IXOPE|nr:hypothetical protein HPB47_024357 [Ixodes persulcatus]